ncbi:uncharacterized protein A4U43_C07F24410 [Asparagus officinalis]|uniref:LysM domain-containing protein n=1 Tax=Asparagus officinalis TaxID=4686 RepID=A0A5P1EEI5_ASPOF|nr:uncharacterized protein A4U43_C07F24410 [Asparagus officinalis]
MLVLRKEVMASRISKRMPEYPCRRVLMRTSMMAQVAEVGRVLPESLPESKILALRNLKAILEGRETMNIEALQRESEMLGAGLDAQIICERGEWKKLRLKLDIGDPFKLAIDMSIVLFSLWIGPKSHIHGVETTPVPICKEVHGVKNGDTCFDVTRKFNLTPGEFIDLNPNLVCKKLFIGQWLCVNGIVLS